jgi:hypothetical protein
MICSMMGALMSDYLSETLPLYTSELNGWVTTYRHDQVEWWDDGRPFAQGQLVTHTGDEQATWWTVGVYTQYQQYGGPEEGGWYYYAGELTWHGAMRFFSDYDEADAYRDKLWGDVEKANKAEGSTEMRLTVRCTTESMPDTHYPKERPYYS